jgi:hypothetical protein
MPKKKGGKVQGRAKQKAKAQNVSAPGSNAKPAWMKKFAKSFDDGRSLLPFPSHANSAPAFHSLQAPFAETLFLPHRRQRQ